MAEVLTISPTDVRALPQQIPTNQWVGNYDNPQGRIPEIGLTLSGPENVIFDPIHASYQELLSEAHKEYAKTLQPNIDPENYQESMLASAQFTLFAFRLMHPDYYLSRAENGREAVRRFLMGKDYLQALIAADEVLTELGEHADFYHQLDIVDMRVRAIKLLQSSQIQAAIPAAQ